LRRYTKVKVTIPAERLLVLPMLGRAATFAQTLKKQDPKL
jgi:hypothetical protein